MEERRLLIAVALSLVVLTAYQFLYPPKPPRRPAPGPSPAAVASGPPAAAPSPVASAGPAGTVPMASPTPVPGVGDDRERRVEVRSEHVDIAFSNKGARLVSWKLRRFTDAAGRPEEMVTAAPGGPRGLDLETGDVDLDARLREALFLPSAEVLTIGEKGETELAFRFAEGDLEAEKTLRFRPPGYVVEVSARVRKGGADRSVKVLWGPGVGNPSAAEREVQGYHDAQVVVDTPSGVERIPADKIPEPRTLPVAHWAGVEGLHFAALVAPPDAPGVVEIRAVPLRQADDGKTVPAPVAAVPVSAGGHALVYVGPKDHTLLASLGNRFVDVVPVGEWIGPIVVPLMALLRWVNGFVGNYGWAIVALTVLINLAMAPLRHYSIANGLRMARLAPEMKVIQERYRKVPALDPRRQEMQQEIGALYARHGMNMGTQMLVGCLPLLLTMPFLIAFYRVLQVSIELRGASFLWVPDLSQRDPLYLTPVLMGASMWLMQKMTPTTMDPAQQRIMMMMPVILVVMFHAAPSGLNLYWLASNACAIVQQGVTLRLLRAKEDAAGRPRKR
jgi:YidC/Oxa1 family membrane protein insertase